MMHSGTSRQNRFPGRTSFQAVRLGATLGLTGLLLPLTGCIDEDAALRSELQEKITIATVDLSDASVIVAAPFEPDSVAQARAKLSGITSSMSSVNGGDPGQQAAAHLLVASANQQIARLDQVEIDTLESAASPLLFAAASELNVALRLNAFASGIESSDSSHHRAQLRSFMTEMEEIRSQLSSELAGLDGPIDDRRSQNESDARQATQLTEEANRLYGRAESLGHADGLDSFVQAIRLERESDSFQLKIAHRDNELEYDYRPRHAIAQSRIDSLNNVLSEVGTVMDDLESHDRLTSDQAAHTRGAVRAFGQRISTTLDTLEESDSRLDEFYSAAISRLESAASAAQRAASKDRSAASSAHLTRARALEQMGQVHSRRGRMLAARISLLAGVVEATDLLGTGSGVKSRLTAAQSAYDASRTAAHTAYTKAQEALGQAGNDPAISLFKISITEALEQLGGPATDG